MTSVPMKSDPSERIENRLRRVRMDKGLSQGALARVAGVTRQAVCAIEANQYLPATAVALRLANALGTRVEDLFSLSSPGHLIEAQWAGPVPFHLPWSEPARVKVTRIGSRVWAWPVSGLGEVLNFTVPADGLMMAAPQGGRRGTRKSSTVQVRLVRDHQAIEREIVVGGCDPAVFLLGDYLQRRLDRASVVGWPMGSSASVEALKRGQVHVAGIHIVDPKSGESNLPYLRRHFKKRDITIVTFASWEQGLMIRRGNPKGIRQVADLVRRDVSLINRETGAGARLLLDRQLATSGIAPGRVRGYERAASSHLEVAQRIALGQGDVGIGVQAAARLLGLDFLPIQRERYDLVAPSSLFSQHPTLSMVFDTLVTQTFRREVEALGGYDTQETGRIVEWDRPSVP